MAQYIHELPDWPAFRYDRSALAPALAAVRFRQGTLLGRMETLGFSLRQQAVLDALTEEVRRSSEIEGEILDPDQVRSSVARRLGMEIGALLPQDRYVDGVVEIALDAVQRYSEPLVAERLYGWHSLLFPTGYSGMRRILVGSWRDDRTGPMRVVSGPIGRERVHYVAPAADRLEIEMARYLQWFGADIEPDWVMKAAIAHLWFVAIHPFDDGNGRIARTVTELALARSECTDLRFYSMSAEIRRDRRAYYDVLDRSCRSPSMDVTPWTEWFLGCLGRALSLAEDKVDAVLRKARFWSIAATRGLNERQQSMMNRLWDGFTGKLTTSKWAKIAKCSHDTALRDIADLIARSILVKEDAGGRSTSYRLADNDEIDDECRNAQ